MKIRLDFAHGFGKALRLAKRRTHSIQADADGGGVMQKRANRRHEHARQAACEEAGVERNGNGEVFMNAAHRRAALPQHCVRRAPDVQLPERGAGSAAGTAGAAGVVATPE